ncbi:MAG: SGNH/GDSL hydrolase family protein [Flavobacteriaceae bacterium]
MKYLFYIIFLFSYSINSQETNQTEFYGKEHFLIEGTIVPDHLKESPYDRLPVSYKEIVRTPVWDLSKSSAGISIRFSTNTSNLKIKWEVLNNFSMDHMPDTGIKGVDLYYRNGQEWQYLNTGRPKGLINEYTLIENMKEEMREFKIFLPLYDGIKNIEIGIDSTSNIIKPTKNKRKPIIFYGTSITQGGCASRPGMAHTNIISRKLDIDVVNFGFSGNGRMEQPIAEIISSVEPSLYIIECMPNMIKPELITERTIPLVNTIREKNPNTPIIFVDLFKSPITILNIKAKSENIAMDNALKAEFEKMIKNGYKNIYLIETPKLADSDHEGTVDGIHFTDLGFLRYADFLISQLRAFELIADLN